MARARASLQAHPHPPELDAELATLETLAALYAGRNNLAHVKLQCALSLPRSPDGVVAAYLPAIRGYLMFGEPRTREQRHADAEQAYAAFTRLGHLRGRIETLVAAQWIHTMYADSASTRIAADRVLQLLGESGMEGSTFGLYSHLYAAQILYFTDHVAEAKQRLRRVIELTGDDVSSNVLPYHALVRLQLCTLAESEDAALDIDPVADAVQYRRAIAASSPIIIAHTAVFRLLRDIRLRRFERCMDSVAIFDRTVETLTGENSPMVQLAVLLAAVVTGRCDDFLLSRIADLHRYAYDLQHYSNSMMAHVMLVLVLQQQGREAEAMASLRTLLTEVERTGHVRYLLDFSPLLRQMLRTVGTPFAERMYQRAYGSTSGNAFGLSDTELRVLKSLSSRQNSVEIAAAMYVSVNTVRTHIRNLYRKLHVHSRDEALDVARETGLLQPTKPGF